MSESEMIVELREEDHRGRFELMKDGARVGMITFSRLKENEIIADHTETDDAIRGMGGGKRLFVALVDWARETHTRVRATCPFVIAMFERDPDSRDVYAQ